MTLTRARVVIAPDGMADEIEATIHDVLTAPRDPDGLLRDVADMRARIAREHEPGDVWNVKYYRGGMIDIEFLAQYLQLRHAHGNPSVLAANTTVALARLADADVLDRAVAEDLIGNYARKLVTVISGGVLDLLYPVLERHSFDDVGEMA